MKECVPRDFNLSDLCLMLAMRQYPVKSLKNVGRITLQAEADSRRFELIGSNPAGHAVILARTKNLVPALINVPVSASVPVIARGRLAQEGQIVLLVEDGHLMVRYSLGGLRVPLNGIRTDSPLISFVAFMPFQDQADAMAQKVVSALNEGHDDRGIRHAIKPVCSFAQA